jgi:hypothetical protein
MSASLAGLTTSGGNVYYQTSASSTLQFTPGASAGTFEASYFVRDVLTLDTGAGEYALASPSGSLRRFNSSGQLLSFQSAGGTEATVTYVSGSPSYILFPALIAKAVAATVKVLPQAVQCLNKKHARLVL